MSYPFRTLAKSLLLHALNEWYLLFKYAKNIRRNLFCNKNYFTKQMRDTFFGRFFFFTFNCFMFRIFDYLVRLLKCAVFYVGISSKFLSNQFTWRSSICKTFVSLLIPVTSEKWWILHLFFGGFLSLSPLISLIFMTSPESKVVQIGLRQFTFWTISPK